VTGFLARLLERHETLRSTTDLDRTLRADT
jgi:hypothetical protein